MPTYVYRCRKCRHRFELFHSITDETPKRCPRCKARAERVPAGGAGILFKGSGFYITDYRSRSYREKAKQEKPAAGTGSGGSGSAPAAGSGSASGSGSAGAPPARPPRARREAPGGSSPPAGGA